MTSSKRKGIRSGSLKPSPAGDPAWEKFFQEHHVTEGSFVRGLDCSGNPCAGVVWYSILSCHHLEIWTVGPERKQLHVNRTDMQLIADQDMTPAELAFATKERAALRALGRFYEFTAGMRGCPNEFQALMGALESSSVNDHEGDICFSLTALSGYFAFPGDDRPVKSNALPLTPHQTANTPAPATVAQEECGDICGSLVALPGYIAFPE